MYMICFVGIVYFVGYYFFFRYNIFYVYGLYVYYYLSKVKIIYFLDFLGLKKKYNEVFKSFKMIFLMVKWIIFF